MLHKTKIKAPRLEKRKDPLQNEKFGYCYMICMTVANYGNTMLTSERKVQGHTTRSNSEFNTVLKRWGQLTFRVLNPLDTNYSANLPLLIKNNGE